MLEKIKIMLKGMDKIKFFGMHIDKKITVKRITKKFKLSSISSISKKSLLPL